MKQILFLSLVGLGLAACNPGLRIAAGPQTEEDRVVPSFDEIVVEGAMDVFITQDSSYVIRVEAPENLLEHIRTDVSSGELKIWEEHNHVIHTRPVKVFISQSVIDRIELNGSGDVEADHIVSSNFDLALNGSGDIHLDVSATSLNVDLRGSGDIDLRGAATDLVVELNGSGDVDARNLPVTNAEVEVDGSGDISVDVSTILDIDIEGSGNVYYWGNPTAVTTNITGSGNAHDME